MKIYLNLLPENRKKAISRKKRLKNIVKQEMVFLLPVVLFLGILFSINLILETQNDGMDEVFAMAGSQNNYQDLKLYEEGFMNVNERVIDINKFQDNHLFWSEVLDILLGNVPEGVYLSDLSTRSYQIFLIGKARERGILIDFQDKMGKSECFENINVPLSNLVAKSDIDFQMDFNIKRECLIGKK